MTEQPEWLSKYGKNGDDYGHIELWRRGMTVSHDALVTDMIAAMGEELDAANDRIARLEAGQRELEARLGDDGK